MSICDDSGSDFTEMNTVILPEMSRSIGHVSVAVLVESNTTPMAGALSS